MLFSFFKKKKKQFPEFWNKHLLLFKNHTEKPLKETRFVFLDTETTGLKIKFDRILSIGAISATANIIDIQDSFEQYIKQDVFKKDTVKIHGIRKNGVYKIEELQALKLFINYIQNDILVAHHSFFDIGIINEALKRNGLGKLQNKCLDTGVLFKATKLQINVIDKHYSLDDLCEELKIPKNDRHTDSGDALITALAFQKIIGRLQKKKNLTVKDLLQIKK